MIINAAQKDIDFYVSKFYPLQDLILDCFDTDYFYLTGEPALSRFYYNHRYSDDLDFFFDGFKYSSEKFDIHFRRIAYSIEQLVDNIEIPIENEFFKRIFIKKNNIELKIEFILEKYKTIGEKQKVKNFF